MILSDENMMELARGSFNTYYAYMRLKMDIEGE